MLRGLSDEMRQKYYKLDLHFPLKSNALIVRLATNQSTTVWVWIFWQKNLYSQPKVLNFRKNREKKRISEFTSRSIQESNNKMTGSDYKELAYKF